MLIVALPEAEQNSRGADFVDQINGVVDKNHRIGHCYVQVFGCGRRTL